MVVAQKVKESEITEQDSLLLTRNLLRIAIFNISYIRGLFPEKYFSDKSVPALDMKIKKLMPLDAESRRLVDWMEKGVYDALQKKYLKTLLFCVCERVDGPMIEEYTFSFSYSNSDSQEVSMNINRSGTKKGGTFKHESTEITPSQMRSSACKMVRTLIQLMRTLDKMPAERTVLMKLLYYDDVTPMDYEPPFFRGCTEEEGYNTWTRSPLKMEVGNVNSKHLVLALKVKSVLDPCEDENNDSQDDEISLGANSPQKDDTESDSEISDDDQYVVAPIDERKSQEHDGAMDEDSDDTQDPVEDDKQLDCLKEWITSYNLDTFQITDMLSSFPAISEILIEDILDKLVKEDIISKVGDGSYVIIKKKKFDYDFDAVKEEMDVEVVENDAKDGTKVVDHMYMRALYHALPMDYITVAKLQKKLDGEANLTTARKLIDKMAHDGFVEATNNRRLGKRVIHSDLTKKKLVEVNKLLGANAMDLDVKESLNKKSKLSEEIIGDIPKNSSTCGGLHSIGSDVTRTKGNSDTNMNNSVRSDQDLALKNANGVRTPTSMAQPAVSRESFGPRADGGKVNGSTKHGDDMAIVNSAMSSLDKRFRKTSMVKDPILQSTKRQKCVAA